MSNRGRACGGLSGNPHRTAVLSLPDGVLPGVIVGSGGDNVKWVVRETGVRFVSVTDNNITLGGAPAQVAAARRLLERQMRALQEAGEQGRLRLESDFLKNCFSIFLGRSAEQPLLNRRSNQLRRIDTNGLLYV